VNDGFQCGYVALIGKPNTGKSTLMNALVGEKLSITAHRPQTTTPGIHDNNSKAIHRYMNRAATSMFDDADLICVLLDITFFNQDDEKILQRVAAYENVLIVVNKVDQLTREACLPLMQKISQLAPRFECVPVSALTGDNLERLEQLIVARLPVGVPHFPDDQLTDKSMRFISAEIVREKLFRALKQELPYSITVSIDHYIEEADITRISATIWVERKSQKAIVIGKKGDQLKKIGSLARADIEKLLGNRVYLQLWVKIRADWADDEQSLAAFGYSDGSPDF
jgi:GTP-binding protein Era